MLGFCFSFPLEQTARDSGTLIKWVKGFDNAGVEGHDVVELLREAFQRKVCNLSLSRVSSPRSVHSLDSKRQPEEQTRALLVSLVIPAMSPFRHRDPNVRCTVCGDVQDAKVDIPVLLNDTVGTLACARYGDGMHQTDTVMSLIVGTGARRNLVRGCALRTGQR